MNGGFNPVQRYGYYPAEYKQYDTQYQGAKEVIGWNWYDTVTYVSGTTVTLTLFTTARATLDLSNMEVTGQLAAPKAFFCRSIIWYLKQRPRSVARAAATAAQTGAIDNIAQLSNTGVLSITIGQKLYGQYPIWRLCSGGGAFGAFGAEGATADPGAQSDWATLGIPDPRAVFTLAKPLFIAPQINFNVVLTWPTAITLAATDTTMSVVLDGDLIRPVQ